MELFLWILVIVLGYALGNLNGALLVSKLFITMTSAPTAAATRPHQLFPHLRRLFCRCRSSSSTWARPSWPAHCPGLLGGYGWGLEAKMVAGVAAILGHSYPAASQFKGGKGILSGAAMAAAIDWRVFMIIFAIFGSPWRSPGTSPWALCWQDLPSACASAAFTGETGWSVPWRCLPLCLSPCATAPTSVAFFTTPNRS